MRPTGGSFKGIVWLSRYRSHRGHVQAKSRRSPSCVARPIRPFGGAEIGSTRVGTHLAGNKHRRRLTARRLERAAGIGFHFKKSGPAELRSARVSYRRLAGPRFGTRAGRARLRLPSVASLEAGRICDPLRANAGAGRPACSHFFRARLGRMP